MRIPHSRIAYWPALPAAVLLLLGPTAGVGAQEPLPPLSCPQPIDDIGAVVAEIEAVAEGQRDVHDRPRRTALSSVIGRIFQDEPCPLLAEPTMRAPVVLGLLDRASELPNPEVAGPLMQMVSWHVFRRNGELAEAVSERLVVAVENAVSRAARWQALRRLVIEGSDPVIFERLLSLARRPEGPVGWPDLPVDLVEHLRYMPQPGAQALYEALRAAPERVNHPRAEWELRCALDRGVPRPLTDPCHPANAPPRIQGGVVPDRPDPIGLQ